MPISGISSQVSVSDFDYDIRFPPWRGIDVPGSVTALSNLPMTDYWKLIPGYERPACFIRSTQRRGGHASPGSGVSDQMPVIRKLWLPNADPDSWMEILRASASGQISESFLITDYRPLIPESDRSPLHDVRQRAPGQVMPVRANQISQRTSLVETR